MSVSENLLNEIKIKCYITDTSDITVQRLTNIVKEALPTVKRMLGVSPDFDFEAEGNEEELKLLKNYCWYDWNDCANEFKINYLDDINSLRHKYEVKQYEQEEAEQL